MRKEDLKIQQSLEPTTFSKKAFQYQLEIAKDKYIPNPDVLKIIQNAKEKGIKIAVATSSVRERAITLLTLVGVYDKLDAFVSCEDITKGKPNPESFLKAAELLHIKPENCVVIEDAINGIQAAKNAGMKVIAKVKPERISEGFNQADICFENFKDLSLADIENIFIK
jgi:HAD superfamily hydrolase (TIGR01509 family)